MMDALYLAFVCLLLSMISAIVCTWWYLMEHLVFNVLCCLEGLLRKLPLVNTFFLVKKKEKKRCNYFSFNYVNYIEMANSATVRG
ncbi:hypothetical protein Hanom_Chr16g01456961 [Helianthus anomalus]